MPRTDSILVASGNHDASYFAGAYFTVGTIIVGKLLSAAHIWVQFIVNIPKGSAIQSALLRFTPNATDTLNGLNVVAIAHTDPGVTLRVPLSDGDPDVAGWGLLNQIASKASPIAWVKDVKGASTTWDVTAILREFIELPQYRGFAGMLLTVKLFGSLVASTGLGAYDYGTSPAKAAELYVTYYVATATHGGGAGTSRRSWSGGCHGFGVCGTQAFLPL